MIKVVGKINKNDKGWGMNLLCYRFCDCGAILEFRSGEVTSDISNDDYCEYINCPCCNNKVYIIAPHKERSG